MRSLSRPSFLFILSAFFFILDFAVAAHAQETRASTVELSAPQLDLYVRAQDAYQSEEFATSIELLERANAIEPFDLFFFGMGRAYFKRGECREAKSAYEKATVARSSGVDLEARLQEATQELSASCPGYLSIECAHPSTRISIDGGPDLACPVHDLELAPGLYEVRATHEQTQEIQRVGIVAMEEHLQRFAIEASVTTPLDPPPAPLDTRRVLARTGIVTGSGLLLTSIVLDVTWVRSEVEDLERASIEYEERAQIQSADRDLTRARFTVLGLGALGALALGTGITIALTPPKEERVTLSLRSTGLSLDLVF